MWQQPANVRAGGRETSSSIKKNGTSAVIFLNELPEHVIPSVREKARIVDKVARKRQKRRLMLQHSPLINLLALPEKNVVLAYVETVPSVCFMGGDNRATGDSVAVTSFPFTYAPALANDWNGLFFSDQPANATAAAVYLAYSAAVDFATQIFNNAGVSGYSQAIPVQQLIDTDPFAFNVKAGAYTAVLAELLDFQRNITVVETATKGLLALRDHHMPDHLYGLFQLYPLEENMYVPVAGLPKLLDTFVQADYVFKDKFLADRPAIGFYGYIQISSVLEVLAYRLQPTATSAINEIVVLPVLTEADKEAEFEFNVPGIDEPISTTLPFWEGNIPAQFSVTLTGGFVYYVLQHSVVENELIPEIAYFTYSGLFYTTKIVMQPLAYNWHSDTLFDDLGLVPPASHIDNLQGTAFYGGLIRFGYAHGTTDLDVSSTGTTIITTTTTEVLDETPLIYGAAELDYDAGPQITSLALSALPPAQVTSETHIAVDLGGVNTGWNITHNASVVQAERTHYYKTENVLEFTTTISGTEISLYPVGSPFSPVGTPEYTASNGFGFVDSGDATRTYRTFFALDGKTIVRKIGVTDSVEQFDEIFEAPISIELLGEQLAVTTISANPFAFNAIEHWKPNVLGGELQITTNYSLSSVVASIAGFGWIVSVDTSLSKTEVGNVDISLPSSSGLFPISAVWNRQLPVYTPSEVPCVITIYLVNTSFAELGRCKLAVDTALITALHDYIQGWAEVLPYVYETNSADPGSAFDIVDAQHLLLLELLNNRVVENDFMSPHLLDMFFKRNSRIPLTSFVVYNTSQNTF